MKIYNVGNSGIGGLQRFLYRGAAKLVPLFVDLLFFWRAGTLGFSLISGRGVAEFKKRGPITFEA